MRISKFVNNPNKPFHTSGYAQAANGDGIGATSSETFSRRKRVDQNRKAIRKYRESHMGRAAMPDRMRARAVTTQPLRSVAKPTPSRQKYNAGDTPLDAPSKVTPIQPKFQEPSKPTFDPFK